MMIEKELADKTLDIIRLFMTGFRQELSLLLENVDVMLSHFIKAIAGAMIGIILVTAVVWFFFILSDRKFTKKEQAFLLLKAEKESYYWTVISQCADIQLENLLDLPLRESSRMHSDAMDLTREHFEPRKEVIHRDDYD